MLFTICTLGSTTASSFHNPPTPTPMPTTTGTPLSWQTAATASSQHPARRPISELSFPRYLKGKTASLSWINGNDCHDGVQAYLRSADTNPNAALVGTGWLNALDGSLISDYNNCVPHSHSMDSVVQLVHSKGGMAYLTITMDTADSYGWSYQQGAAYVVEATKNVHFIDSIVAEVKRVHYDGVIMDVEGVDNTYPAIQNLFATFNQRMWAALQPLQKQYGIALIHKLSDRDEYYNINGFENWSLLAHAADFIVIMAVDQSYRTPGPAVSVSWLKQLLAYARRTMPTMLANIVWELPLYGNSWHQEGKTWVLDGIITYRAARKQAQQIAPTQIDRHASNLHDFYMPHLVYTDKAGIRHAIWYLTAQGLYAMIAAFQDIVRQESGLDKGNLQVAFWWRTTQEPVGFWQMLDMLYQ